MFTYALENHLVRVKTKTFLATKNKLENIFVK